MMETVKPMPTFTGDPVKVGIGFTVSIIVRNQCRPLQVIR